jgi:hypothetical protein
MFTLTERIATKKMAYRAGAPDIKAIVDQCKFELATNFDCPSNQILGVYGARFGFSSQEMGRLVRELA